MYGWPTAYGYLGWVPDLEKMIWFATEEEYKEYYEERSNGNV